MKVKFSIIQNLLHCKYLQIKNFQDCIKETLDLRLKPIHTAERRDAVKTGTELL